MTKKPGQNESRRNKTNKLYIVIMYADKVEHICVYFLSSKVQSAYHKQFPLGSASQSSVSLLVRRRKFPSLIFQLLELLEFWHTEQRDDCNTVRVR